MRNANQKNKRIISVITMKLGTTAAIIAFGLVGNFLSSTIAFGSDESEICVAQMVKEGSFLTTMNYQVNCKNEAFSSEKINTAAVIPFPYRWRHVARKRLATLMSSKGYMSPIEIKEFSERQEVRNNQSNELSEKVVSLAFHDSILLFSKSSQSPNTLQNYCGVIQTPLREEGLSQVKLVSDFVVSCTKDSVSKHFKGVTIDEFNQYMATTFETKLVFTTAYRGKGEQGSLHIYQ